MGDVGRFNREIGILGFTYRIVKIVRSPYHIKTLSSALRSAKSECLIAGIRLMGQARPRSRSER